MTLSLPHLFCGIFISIFSVYRNIRREKLQVVKNCRGTSTERKKKEQIVEKWIGTGLNAQISLQMCGIYLYIINTRIEHCVCTVVYNIIDEWCDVRLYLIGTIII